MFIFVSAADNIRKLHYNSKMHDRAILNQRYFIGGMDTEPSPVKDIIKDSLSVADSSWLMDFWIPSGHNISGTTCVTSQD